MAFEKDVAVRPLWLPVGSDTCSLLGLLLMARIYPECTSENIRDLNLAKPCNATICCTGICCFINRHQRELWETWYFWFGVVLIFLFVLTSAFSYMVTSCKRKQQNLIRIRNITTPGAPSITTISGPGGIIQPQVNYKGQLGMQATAFIGSPEMYLEDYASPLDAPYPPVQPVTIVRGTVPPQGYRQTNQYTELVLPPGYVDTESRVKHLIASQ